MNTQSNLSASDDALFGSSDAEKYADPSGPRRMIGCSQERVEEQLRIALDGHPESELWGENGLIAATMRSANATSTALSGRLVGFDCREKTLTFAMDAMPSTGTLGESGLIYLPNATCSAGPLTAEMIREMLGHVPYDVGDMPDRWEWMANYLNETLRDPGVICPCCNITRRGELMDHLPRLTRS